MSASHRPNVLAPAFGEHAGSEALQKLRRKEIALGEYLDLHADRAVSHLKGLIGPARLEYVRAMLRENLTSDPVLVEYLQRGTGLSADILNAS
jgi:hypothetical protein